MLKPFLQKDRLEAGCDEAGRGCLAGPVFAAAVILPPGFAHPGLNDSKQLSAKLRNELRPVIESNAVSFAVARADHQEIDSLNILRASLLAMHRAISTLNTKPEFLLIDGNKFNPYPGIEHKTIVKGDSIYLSIAAASVLAKTYRDEYMLGIHGEFPHYGWDTNKGYPTIKHRKAILEYGISPYHRKSFSLISEQFRLNFD